MILSRRLIFLSLGLVLFACVERTGYGRVAPVPAPREMQSNSFQVTANGRPVDVVHAAASYDYVSIESSGPVTLAVTAADAAFWDKGVDVQPWRLGIRPTRKGGTIEFKLKDAAKLSISRPQDFLNHARMLFVFVTRPAPVPDSKMTAMPGFHAIGPGLHKGSLNPKSGDTYYLAPGAVVIGSLNLWQVENVKVLGHGVIVYDGPQNPKDDDGWMQKKDWHCIGAKDARHVEIHGVTCLVRSRTWSIQMKDSNDFLYDDIRVIGGNPSNSNQDGMDWLGGGNTMVRDSFFRASDDVFALQGNWDGYNDDQIAAPGHDVSNIIVEHSVLSTSISNIVRAGWPQKTFNSHNFTLRDSDILQGGIGSCGLPFALFTFWGAKGAKGDHSGYTFENLWLDDWYSLFQVEQEQPALHGFVFKNLWALGQPPLVKSRLQGSVSDVHVENVKYSQSDATSDAKLSVSVTGGAQEPIYSGANPQVKAAIHMSPSVVQPGVMVTFLADTAADRHARYTWSFGDGTTAVGKKVRHKFTDTRGSDLDGTDANGSGRFRVLLKVDDRKGNQDWAALSVVVVGHWHDAGDRDPGAQPTVPGLAYRIYPGTWPELPNFSRQKATSQGVAASLRDTDAGGFTRYAAVYEGYLQVPAEGGYSFHLMSRDGARLTIDGQEVTETGPPFGEVCGSPVNAVRYARGSIGLRAGKHLVRLESLETVSPERPKLLWEATGLGISEIPASAFSHPNSQTVLASAAGPLSGAKSGR